MPTPTLKHLRFEEMTALPKDAAGRKMIASVPLSTPHETVEEMRKRLEAELHGIEAINYIFVVDEWGKLVGVLSLKDIYRLPPHHTMGEVCKNEGLVFVHPTEHQERVAYLALRHNVKSVPVLDDDHRFLGVIPGDVILRILYKEVHEDLLRLVGVRHGSATVDNIFDLSIVQLVRHRIPWLFIGLLGGLLAAKVIGAYEEVLERNLVLAGFIPLIVYMSGAVGTQMEAFVIRDLAFDKKLNFWKYLLKQLSIIMIIGALFSILLMAIGEYVIGNGGVAIVLGIALFCAILSSVFTGLIIPYAFSRFRMDPANASGPIATVIQDLISVFIYFFVAQLLL